MILYSESGRATATANLLQALVAIPKMRTLAENLLAIPSEQSGTTEIARKYKADLLVMNYVSEIIQREACSDDSFMGVDEVTAEMSGPLSSHNELPPVGRVLGMGLWSSRVRIADGPLRSVGSNTARCRRSIR